MNYRFQTKEKRMRAMAVRAVGVVLMLGFFVFMGSLSYSTVSYQTITVTEKERITKKETSYYLVFTDGEVFKNEDSLLQLKFNSSDVHSQLKVGGTYSCKVNWFRVPFLSMYRNIIECK